MSYLTISTIAEDPVMRRRTAACAAVEGVPDPEGWAYLNSLLLAAEPGWSEAWESAVAGGNPDPGGDGAVITDTMVLSAVQKLRAAEAAAAAEKVE
jgi:hypothetical protein